MVYLKLTEAVGEEEAALYRNRVEEIQPSLRYCAYNVGDQSAISDLQNMRTSLGQDSLILDKLDVGGLLFQIIFILFLNVITFHLIKIYYTL